MALDNGLAANNPDAVSGKRRRWQNRTCSAGLKRGQSIGGGGWGRPRGEQGDARAGGFHSELRLGRRFGHGGRLQLSDSRPGLLKMLALLELGDQLFEVG